MFKAPSPPPQPKMPDPVRMVNPTDPDIMLGKRRAATSEFASRQGRASTDLAPAAGVAPAYTRSTLGA